MANISLGYVITWRYSDGSGSGAVCAFTDKDRAERMLDLLNKQDSMRSFKLEPVPFDSDGSKEPASASSDGKEPG